MIKDIIKVKILDVYEENIPFQNSYTCVKYQFEDGSYGLIKLPIGFYKMTEEDITKAIEDHVFYGRRKNEDEQRKQQEMDSLKNKWVTLKYDR